LYFNYTYVAKKTKNEKKMNNSVPPFQMAVMEKNKKESNLSRLSRTYMCQGRGIISAVSNGGNEENDKKKNQQK